MATPPAQLATSFAAGSRSSAVRLLAFTAAASGLALLLAVGPPLQEGLRPRAFEYLYRAHEPIAAWTSLALMLLAVLAAPFLGGARAAVAALSRRPHLFIAAVTAGCAAAALLVYRAHPLSMDEYAPLFQARAFAAGALAGKVPPDLVPRLIPGAGWFIEASPSGRLISAYWPGFALLLAPFARLGVPWLLNPLLAGASLYLLWWTARRTCSAEDAPGWTLLLAAASPAFTVNAISLYSMTAHLCASLCFAALLLDATPRRLALAGAVGSFALALHNPVPHALFALPWLVALALRPRPFRNLALLALGYLPGVLLLGVGWLWVRSLLVPTAAPGGSAPILAMGASLLRLAFRMPSSELLQVRAAGLVKLALWAVPGLLPLAWWGARERKGDWWWRALGLSAVATLLGYFFVPYDQGHGWGYRYFHSAWCVLPLFAAAALSSEAPERGALRGTMFAACAGSLIALTGLRLAQVRGFVDGHLAQIPAAPAGARLEVVFVQIDRGYYTIDLVQDDPFLSNRRWILISRGKREDESWIRRVFPSARLRADNGIAAVWQTD